MIEKLHTTDQAALDAPAEQPEEPAVVTAAWLAGYTEGERNAWAEQEAKATQAAGWVAASVFPLETFKTITILPRQTSPEQVPVYLGAPSARRQPDTPVAESLEEAARDVAKCLNERDGEGLDLRHVAMLAHAVSSKSFDQEAGFAGKRDVPQAVWDKLHRLQVGRCTCMTKTPELEHHRTDCVYRLASEIEILLSVPSPDEG